VKFISFDKWREINESAAFKFDSLARYADPTFGLNQGKIDSSNIAPGGLDANWGGSMPRALAFAKIANDFMGKNVVVSQKRSREMTASGNMSDHFKGNQAAYAIDLAVTGEEGDKLLAHLMEWFGHPEYKGESWFNVVKDGYRYQVGWKVKDHFDHIHIGVKKVNRAGTESSTVGSSTVTKVTGNTFAEKLINNQDFLTWYTGYAPAGSGSPTAQFIEGYLTANPDKKNWFMNRFNLNSDGDKLEKVKAQAETKTDSAELRGLTTQKVTSKYTGEKARNIDLLVSEMQSQGVTNKNAILGMLATIGKESGFVPKNEIPYNNTDNSRIRKIFGSRMKDLTDEQLDALKKDTVKFWDRVYGADDPTGKSQQYGNSEPGDGAKYLGRGFNGITFKGNYKKYGDMIGMDLVSNPEVLNDTKVAAQAAVKFLLTVLKKMGIDPNSFTNTNDAVKAFVQANHGGQSAPQEGLIKANEVLKNLNVA
jgi:putative chitinase